MCEGCVPLAVGLFLFVLIGGLVKLIPCSFAAASRVVLAVAVDLAVVVKIAAVNFFGRGFEFFALFMPRNLKRVGFVVPIVFLVRLVSCLVEIVDLSIELDTGLVDNRALLGVVTGFKLGCSVFFPLLLLLPLSLLYTVCLLRVNISVVRTCIFALLAVACVESIRLLRWFVVTCGCGCLLVSPTLVCCFLVTVGVIGPVTSSITSVRGGGALMVVPLGSSEW